MNNIMVILKKELKHYFYSPMAYIIMAVFLFISGYFFLSGLDRYVQVSMQAASPYAGDFELTAAMVIGGFLGNICIVLMFIIPLLCMRAVSEERKSGTFELLMTSPLKNWELIGGKYLSLLTILFILTAIIGIFPLVLYMIMPFYYKTVLISFAGFFLFGAASIAIGLFFSTTSKNPVYAALSTFAALLLLWISSWLSDSLGGFLGIAVRELSMISHINSFIKGTLSLKDLTYFISMIFYMLFLSDLYIDSIRWRE
ncbi:MAG: ABC transporter permease subunit [Candidatus Muiribacteriota bacterium]